MSESIRKSLILLVALLSPLQALQGTPLLCQLSGTCSAIDRGCCDTHTCRCTRCLQAAKFGSLGCGHHSLKFCMNGRKPVNSEKCPTNCWCSHRAQPQQMSQTIEFDLAFDPVSGSLGTLELPEIPRNVESLTHNTSTTQCSALQLCADLCRFLA